MGLNSQGFVNHMLHKKNIWKPEAMTLNEHFCVFIFNQKARVELVQNEVSAFNSYYAYEIEINPKIHAICLMNDRTKLANLVKSQVGVK